MESRLDFLRTAAILSALLLLPMGCCTIDLTCGVGPCGSSCGPVVSRDPLFDGTLRHRVKSSVHACASKVACAGGCGEIYWDESVSDPAVCDRCEYAGHLGGESGTCSPWFVRIAKLWGTPYHANGCAEGSCLGNGSLIHHVRGHRGCSSCQSTHGLDAGGCASCGQSIQYSGTEGEFYEGAIHEGAIDVVPNGHGAPNAPTPAKPPVVEGQSQVPSNAQHRMRLHHHSNKVDPNGRLSVQVVNGHKRLVTQP